MKNNKALVQIHFHGWQQTIWIVHAEMTVVKCVVLWHAATEENRWMACNAKSWEEHQHLHPTLIEQKMWSCFTMQAHGWEWCMAQCTFHSMTTDNTCCTPGLVSVQLYDYSLFHLKNDCGVTALSGGNGKALLKEGIIFCFLFQEFLANISVKQESLCCNKTHSC